MALTPSIKLCTEKGGLRIVGADRRIRPKKTSTQRADTLICPYCKHRICLKFKTPKVGLKIRD